MQPGRLPNLGCLFFLGTMIHINECCSTPKLPNFSSESVGRRCRRHRHFPRNLRFISGSLNTKTSTHVSLSSSDNWVPCCGIPVYRCRLLIGFISFQKQSMAPYLYARNLPIRVCILWCPSNRYAQSRR
jgi:hypothetical protein